MSVKVFIPQNVVDSWVTADKIELLGEVVTFRGSGVAVSMAPACYFDRVAGGSDDGNNLLGRVKTKTTIDAMGAEAYMNSVILGETAYEVQAGFVATPIHPSCTRAVLVAALAQAGF